MGGFNLNLRCAGAWALIAALRLLPPWVRAWAASISTLFFFLCLYGVVLVVWVLLLLLARRAEFKAPLGESVVFQISGK